MADHFGPFSDNAVFTRYGDMASLLVVELGPSSPATIWWLPTILVLKLSLSMPKAVWRVPSTCRTLPPLALRPLVSSVLADSPSDNTSANLIESEVAQDASGIERHLSRRLKEHDSVGVFDISIAGDTVKVRLSQEACRREVYTPRRASQFLTALTPWEPIRVILNGRADWSSGRYYYLQDYHAILCGPMRSYDLLPVRTFDFQADLI